MHKDMVSVQEVKWEGQPFTIIDEANYKKLIPEICDEVFPLIKIKTNVISENEKKYEHEAEVRPKIFLYRFLNNLITGPAGQSFTIVFEDYYIERSFRDTYYMYFSNQHFETEKHSARISFFLGEYDSRSFFSEYKSENDRAAGKSTADRLKEDFIGSMVINPLVNGAIGRTLIAPGHLVPNQEKPVYARLSEFKCNIYGRQVFVKAFPYRMQDRETMLCAEVTLLNLLEYYSNSYNDYRIVVPSEITEGERRSKYERALPSGGLADPEFTRMLMDFGFAPRMYNIHAQMSNAASYVDRKGEMKRLLHYYIESGIPVAVGLSRKGRGIGHTIVCIGHGKYNPGLEKAAEKRKLKSWKIPDIPGDKSNPCSLHTNSDSVTAETAEDVKNEASVPYPHAFINSADYYDKYVVIDDNEPVYSVRNFDNLAPQFPDLDIGSLIVPLYKRMFLDASTAYDEIISILLNENLGANEWGKGFLKEEGENIVIRLFMASSASYKRFRIQTVTEPVLREIYAYIPMPRFIWVCELYRREDYEGYGKNPDGRPLKAFAEIVLDATSAANRALKNLILMHYPNKLAYRLPTNKEEKFDDEIKYVASADCCMFEGYRNNLEAYY